MKWTATYRLENANPFVPDFNAFSRQFATAVADIPDEIPFSQIEEWAKEMTPDGMIFLGVKTADSNRNEKQQ